MLDIEKIVRSKVKKELIQCGPKQPSNAKKKVVTISDLHAPMHNPMVIDHLLAHHSDADVLVINGDIFDLYAASKWLKTKDIAFDAEYRIVSDFVWRMTKRFKKVLITEGNHDMRIKSALMSSIPAYATPLVRTDVLRLICEGYTFDENGELEKTRKMKNLKYTPGPTAWFTQIGDCIFAHPSNSGGVPMGMAVKACDYFVCRGFDFSAIVIGHSHKQGKIIHDGKLIIEQGCACYPMTYEAGGKLLYKHPSVSGYAVIMMDRSGRVDFERSGPVYLGTGTMVATERLMP